MYALTVVIVVLTAVDWTWSGENPITSFLKVFSAGMHK